MTPRASRLGVALCLGAGVAFAIQPVLGQLALDRGAAIAPLLGWRYVIAALVLVVVARRRVAALPPRTMAIAFSLGLVLYAADSALFYAALARTSAPFATLVHYAYLIVVVVAAALAGRERLGARRLAALGAVLVGVALVGGGAAGSPDLLGIGLALGAALAYGAYVLISDRIVDGVDPVAFAAPLVAGAGTAFLAFGAWRGELTTVGGHVGVAAVLVGALVGTVFAVTAFLGGMRLVGPGTASLLVTVEAPAGLLLAGLALGERFAPAQLVGAALVVSAIALLQVRIRLPRRRAAEVHALPVPAAEPAEALAA